MTRIPPPCPMTLLKRITTLLLLFVTSMTLCGCGIFNSLLKTAVRAWPLLIEKDSKMQTVPVRSGPLLSPAPVSPHLPEQPGMAAL